MQEGGRTITGEDLASGTQVRWTQGRKMAELEAAGGKLCYPRSAPRCRAEGNENPNPRFEYPGGVVPPDKSPVEGSI